MGLCLRGTPYFFTSTFPSLSGARSMDYGKKRNGMKLGRLWRPKKAANVVKGVEVLV